MDLRKFESIEIENKKLSDYLLSVRHPDGFSKAKFFIAHGFDKNILNDCLLSHLELNEPNKIIQTVFGKKFVIEGILKAPDNFSFSLRSIWMESRNNNVLKFVTAYPI